MAEVHLSCHGFGRAVGADETLCYHPKNDRIPFYTICRSCSGGMRPSCKYGFFFNFLIKVFSRVTKTGEEAAKQGKDNKFIMCWYIITGLVCSTCTRFVDRHIGLKILKLDGRLLQHAITDDVFIWYESERMLND